MASDKQIAANRRNAMRSTGPRTRSGKARSRANSLRHGLLSKVLVDPALVNETDQLARRIAEEHGKQDDCFESRTIAEAELIILSARAVRAQLLDTASSELAPDTKAADGRHSEEGSRGGKVALACTRFRRHRVRCFDGAGGGSWRDGSLRESSSLRLYA